MPPKRATTAPKVEDLPSSPLVFDDQSDAYISDEEDDGREICEYDEKCYRKNPDHFKKFRHPKKKAMEINGPLKISKKKSHLLKKTLSNEIIQVNLFIAKYEYSHKTI